MRASDEPLFVSLNFETSIDVYDQAASAHSANPEPRHHLHAYPVRCENMPLPHVAVFFAWEAPEFEVGG